MRLRSTVFVLLLIALLLPSFGCGTGGATGLTGGARIGPFVFALPFVPAAGGETVTLGFKNVFGAPATVYVAPYAPGGGAPMPGMPFTVPANGELRVPLSSVVIGTPGGWLCVDTRDPTTLSPATGEPTPVASSGYVFPYIHRQTLGGLVEEDSFEGVTGHPSGVTVAVTPETDTIQLINYSINQVAGGGPAMPIAVTYAVSTFDTAGTLVSTIPAAVPGNGSVTFTPAVTTGSVRIAPMTTPAPPAAPLVQKVLYTAVSRERGLQTFAEFRFHETSIAYLPAQIEYGFEVEFGDDGQTNLHDFEFLMSNTTGTDQTVVLLGVYRAGELPLLEIPRAFVLNAGRTVLMRTRTVDSVGLMVGEESFFDDIFGDVFGATGFTKATLVFQVPATIDVSARHFDPAFANFYRVVRAIPRTNVPCVYDLPIQEFLTTGVRNEISITNTGTGSFSIPVQAYTPGGTLYLLDPIQVGPRTRLDWTPDGLTFREIPTDTLGPFVKYMRFQFFPPGGLYFRGRTTSRDGLGQIRYITPTGNRN